MSFLWWRCGGRFFAKLSVSGGGGLLLAGLVFLAPLAGAETAGGKKKRRVPPADAAEKAVESEEAPVRKKPVHSEKAAEPAGETAPKESAESPAPAKTSRPSAPNASLEPEELADFAAQPQPVQKLIIRALALTRQNLTYTYGSADPVNGGMDCSGTVYYLLREAGLSDVPRDSSGIYVWARKAGRFFAVVSKKAGGFEFADLKPGDILFWNGTYAVDRDPPVSHVMIYLGIEKRRQKPVMVGASDGRSYDGKSRWGVSVFDFTMPAVIPGGGPQRTDFLGYARIPGLATAANGANGANGAEQSTESTESTKSTESTGEPPAKKPRPRSKKRQ